MVLCIYLAVMQVEKARYACAVDSTYVWKTLNPTFQCQDFSSTRRHLCSCSPPKWAVIFLAFRCTNLVFTGYQLVNRETVNCPKGQPS